MMLGDAMPSVWYVARDGQEHGPINEAEFAEFVKGGYLRPSDYVWHDGLDDWLLGKDLLSREPRVERPPAPAAGDRASCP
jgi:uncharacterized protein DUF4339